MATDFNNTTSKSTAGRRVRAARSSRGISLTEVLIAMGVLTIGLLGVAAIFPVGSHYMQRGDLSDRADAIAQAALNDAITRGLLDPENWVAYEDNLLTNANKGWSGANFSTTALGIPNSVTRPFAADYRMRLRLNAEVPNSPDALTASRRINRSVGSVIVVDPLAVSGLIASSSPATFQSLPSVEAFPSSIEVNSARVPVFNVDSGTGFMGGLWLPWSGGSGGSLGWPLQRVTVTTNQPNNRSQGEPMTFAEADRIVTGDDDLALELPDNGDEPSQTRFLSGSNTPLLRQARQEYSWMLTVAPTTHDARNALATGGDGAYDVSAVVFNRRPLSGRGATLLTNGAQRLADLVSLQSTERIVRVSIQSPGQGASGGELLMFRGKPPGSAQASGSGQVDTWWDDALAEESAPWENLRVGQWIFLFGPNNNSSTNERPLLFAQWYRVLSIDDSEEDNTTSSRLRVQVRGPDWPWTNTDNLDTSNFSATATEGTLFAVIVPDVVAVHTRTLNLQSAAVWGQ